MVGARLAAAESICEAFNATKVSWMDGKYYVQARKEASSTGIILVNNVEIYLGVVGGV